MFLFGAAAQFGIFFAICAASLMGFELRDAASIGIIGAADGPTSILVSCDHAPNHASDRGGGGVLLHGAGANHPAICDPSGDDEKRTPDSHDLQSEKCVQNDQDRISDCSYYHCRTDFSGIGGAGRISDVWKPDPRVRRASGTFPDGTERAGKPDYPAAWHHDFVQYACGCVCAVDTLLIMGIGLIAFIFDTIGGVLFAKFMNLFLKTKINPMIGAAGISAFPMSSRVVQKLAMEEEKGNIILMHAVGANVSGQIASVIAGGLVIKLVSQYL